MRRANVFTLKVSDEERLMIDTLARNLERTQSDAIRVVVRKAAVEAGAWFELPETFSYRGRREHEHAGGEA